MRKLGLCTAVALLFSASSAFAYTIQLGPGGVINVGPAGGTLDLTVDVSTLPEDLGVIGIQTNFTADADGLSIVGAVGGTNSAGTGTRYNEADWDTNTNATAFNPNTFSGPMAAGVAKGVYGTSSNGVMAAGTSSNLGHLVITYVAGPHADVHLNPTQADFVGEDFSDNAATQIGVTIHWVPEPASALLLLAALPFLRRRRTA